MIYLNDRKLYRGRMIPRWYMMFRAAGFIVLGMIGLGLSIIEQAFERVLGRR